MSTARSRSRLAYAALQMLQRQDVAVRELVHHILRSEGAGRATPRRENWRMRSA